jgi:Zn-finger nucleic acid-binding protein
MWVVGYHDRVSTLVCLGCAGVVVGPGRSTPPGEVACTCPPAAREERPSAPPASSARGPYRGAALASATCPRCGASLCDQSLGDVDALGCAACGGIFVPREAVAQLLDESDAGRAVRLAFPRTGASVREAAIRYLACPTCKARMNRQNFGRISGVIVDACKEHGVWFDAGELGAIVAWVEGGGLGKMRARQSANLEAAAREARVAARQRRAQLPTDRFVYRDVIYDEDAAAWALRDLVRMLF